MRCFGIYVFKVAASFDEILVLVERREEKELVRHEWLQDFVQVLGLGMFDGFGVYDYYSVFIKFGAKHYLNGFCSKFTINLFC